MTIYAMISYICVVGIASIFIVIFQCDPVEGNWDILIPAKCLNDEIQFIILLVGNISTDIFLLVFVVPRIGRLP